MVELFHYHEIKESKLEQKKKRERDKTIILDDMIVFLEYTKESMENLLQN